MMNLLISLIAILILALLALGLAMSHSMIFILAVVLPYAAFAIFLCGVIYRLITWAKSPVPFRIPTTCGQGKSLPWIKTNPLENPAGSWGVIGRMAQEIFLFRSLFRNTHVEIIDGRPVYGSAKWLWFFGLMFHLVAFDHCAAAPALFYRTDHPLDRRAFRGRRILRNRHPDPLSE